MNIPYYEEQLDKIYDGVIFRFKKINPIDYINLVTKHTETTASKSTMKTSADFIGSCLSYIQWTKDGATWTDLVDPNGNSRLPELDEHPTIGFDLYYAFVQKVIAPVFIESKTFQSLMSQEKTNNSKQ
jgi:hypothetical protein